VAAVQVVAVEVGAAADPVGALGTGRPTESVPAETSENSVSVLRMARLGGLFHVSLHKRAGEWSNSTGGTALLA
jgi:hypothetical protein